LSIVQREDKIDINKKTIIPGAKLHSGPRYTANCVLSLRLSLMPTLVPTASGLKPEANL
jgi:hypothetical protein